MNPRHLGITVALTILFVSRIGYAQTIPTPEDFDRSLKACADNQKINLSTNIVDSISRLYAGESSRQIVRSPSGFLQLIPESNRIEAYRLYADCIAKIVPEIASTTPPTSPAQPPSPPNPPIIYRICTGEYERACQPHEVYLYCYTPVESWAKDRCTTFTVRRLNTYGGNKCGYSLDEVICNGPR
jgi:hypothetical protein